MSISCGGNCTITLSQHINTDLLLMGGDTGHLSVVSGSKPQSKTGISQLKC